VRVVSLSSHALPSPGTHLLPSPLPSLAYLGSLDLSLSRIDLATVAPPPQTSATSTEKRAELAGMPAAVAQRPHYQ